MSLGEQFDAAPDPVLGRLLRERYAGGDAAAFAARVLSLLPRPGSLWDVLAAWARPGLAAALILAAALGYWTVMREARGTPVFDGTEIATGDRPIDNDALMSAALGAGH